MKIIFFSIGAIGAYFMINLLWINKSYKEIQSKYDQATKMVWFEKKIKNPEQYTFEYFTSSGGKGSQAGHHLSVLDTDGNYVVKNQFINTWDSQPDLATFKNRDLQLTDVKLYCTDHPVFFVETKARCILSQGYILPERQLLLIKVGKPDQQSIQQVKQEFKENMFIYVGALFVFALITIIKGLYSMRSKPVESIWVGSGSVAMVYVFVMVFMYFKSL